MFVCNTGHSLHGIFLRKKNDSTFSIAPGALNCVKCVLCSKVAEFVSEVIEQGKVIADTVSHVASKQLLCTIKNGQCLVTVVRVIFLSSGMHS